MFTYVHQNIAHEPSLQECKPSTGHMCKILRAALNLHTFYELHNCLLIILAWKVFLNIKTKY